MKIILLKFGGSLITDKNKSYTTRPEIIHQIISEIKEVYEKNPELKLILGNGAGSFAHQSARKFGTMNGFSENIGLLGAGIVHNDAVRLNQILVTECLKQNLPVFSLQPSSIFISENKEAVIKNLEIIDSLIDFNFIPFLYGDVIIDKKIRSTIFSTDKIFRLIGMYLQAKGHKPTIIQAGNYDGVYDKNHKVIPKITNKNIGKMQSVILGSKSIDVTGGMKNKVQEMLKLASLGINSRIINGGVKGNLIKAIHQEDIGGTLITDK